MPWLTIDDFNEIIGLTEKQRRKEEKKDQEDRWKTLLMLLIIVDSKDVGFIGPKYTWLYQKSDGTQI